MVSESHCGTRGAQAHLRPVLCGSLCWSRVFCFVFNCIRAVRMHIPGTKECDVRAVGPEMLEDFQGCWAQGRGLALALES